MGMLLTGSRPLLRSTVPPLQPSSSLSLAKGLFCSAPLILGIANQWEMSSLVVLALIHPIFHKQGFAFPLHELLLSGRNCGRLCLVLFFDRHRQWFHAVFYFFGSVTFPRQISLDCLARACILLELWQDAPYTVKPNISLDRRLGCLPWELWNQSRLKSVTTEFWHHSEQGHVEIAHEHIYAIIFHLLCQCWPE